MTHSFAAAYIACVSAGKNWVGCHLNRPRPAQKNAQVCRSVWGTIRFAKVKQDNKPRNNDSTADFETSTVHSYDRGFLGLMVCVRIGLLVASIGIPCEG